MGRHPVINPTYLCIEVDDVGIVIKLEMRKSVHEHLPARMQPFLSLLDDVRPSHGRKPLPGRLHDRLRSVVQAETQIQQRADVEVDVKQGLLLPFRVPSRNRVTILAHDLTSAGLNPTLLAI
jgi:hypothetical protein